MVVLKDSSIERGDRTFEVSFTHWGSESRPARNEKCIVLAATRKGARRIVKKHYPRSDNYTITESV